MKTEELDKKIIYRAYKFRIYPDEEQSVFIRKNCGCARLIYNLLLEDKIKGYEAKQKDPDTEYNYKKVKDFRKDFPFLNEVDSMGLYYAQLHLEQAFKNFYNHRDKFGYPKFKSKKHSTQSYTFDSRAGKTAKLLEDDKGRTFLKIPKLKKSIPIVKHREIQGLIKSITISIKPSGKYYASLMSVEELEEPKKTEKCIGIDLGLDHFAILSDGRKFDNNKFTKEAENKLKREQRKLSKRSLVAKKHGKPLVDAKNYQKQKIKVSRLHEKVVEQRNYFLHNLSTQLVNEYDIICLEDLNIKGMMKNNKLARSIADVSWSIFVEMLQYKADWLGKKVIKIDRFFPSSKTCSNCGHKEDEMPLKIRKWTCPKCGTEHDRDVNAAKNILKEGLRLLSENAKQE